jgi:adenosylhomocysteine nucleosidase
VARRLGCPVVAGGGTAAGAAEAAARLIRDGADALISFGLAGGLDPALRPGALAIPRQVRHGSFDYPCDPILLARLRGPTVERLLAAAEVVALPAAKQRLFRETGAAALDIESGRVAQEAAASNIPFAVLRAICDPASFRLPHVALVALDSNGRIRPARVAGALLARPHHLGATLALARDAAIARRALVHHLREIGTLHPPQPQESRR